MPPKKKFYRNYNFYSFYIAFPSELMNGEVSLTMSLTQKQMFFSLQQIESTEYSQVLQCRAIWVGVNEETNHSGELQSILIIIEKKIKHIQYF